MTTENEDRLEETARYELRVFDRCSKKVVERLIAEVEKLRGQLAELRELHKMKKCCCPYCNHCRGWNQ